MANVYLAQEAKDEGNVSRALLSGSGRAPPTEPRGAGMLDMGSSSVSQRARPYSR